MAESHHSTSGFELGCNNFALTLCRRLARCLPAVWFAVIVLAGQPLPSLASGCSSPSFESQKSGFKLMLPASRWKCTNQEKDKSDGSFEGEADDIGSQIANVIVILQPSNTIHHHPDIRSWILDEEVPNIISGVYEVEQYALDTPQMPEATASVTLASGQKANLVQSGVSFESNSVKQHRRFAIIYIVSADGQWWDYVFIYNPKRGNDTDLADMVDLVASKMSLSAIAP